MSIDTKELLERNPIENVIGRYISLRKDGVHQKGKCPFHDDKRASLVVTPNKQLAKCFACGWSGDAIAFVMEYSGLSFKEACESIETQGALTQGDTVKRSVKKSEPRIEWKQRVPPEGFKGDIVHYRHGEPSHVWTYRLEDGRTYGYVCRFDFEDGRKDVIPFVWATDGNRSDWRWKGFDTPRPLYNLHLIKEYPNATVLFVEGEKSADAAQAQLDPSKTVVTCWVGGSNAVGVVDFMPVHNRKVILWGDNDAQGLSAMLHIRHLIVQNVSLCKIVPLDNTLPKGWDCADREWKDGELREFVLSRMVDDIPCNKGKLWRFKQIGSDSIYEFGLDGGRWNFKKIEAPILEQITPELPPEFDDAPPFVPQYNEPESEYINQFFRYLGYGKSENGQQEFYFFVFASKQVYRFTTSSMTTHNLLTLAPLSYWEDEFPSKKTFEIAAAINRLVNTSNKVGTYKGRLIRGRGAWMDAGRSIIHAGDRLIVDFNTKPLGSIETKYIYEASEELDVCVREPLPANEAVKLLELLKRLSWEREINPFLLVGWCIVAPMCGALKWRPHIWLTGAAGTGKSWVFEKVLRRLLGNTALAVQGETSEAGIRQTLGHDALPVVFDESEGADRRANERMQSVMALMRSASAEDGGVMAKGSATGSAKTFRIRSCFAFASIAVQIKQQSDRTRVSIIGLKRDLRPNKKEIWEETIRQYHELLTDEFVERLQSRTIKLLPIILKNAETFASAGAAELGTQRIGDQIGSLLAGVYSLFKSNEITYDEAVAWIRKQDWSDERGLESSADEMRLLSHLLEQIVQVDTAGYKHNRTVGELIMNASGKLIDAAISSPDAEANIRRLGFKIDKTDLDTPWLVISNNSVWISKMLSGTSWPENHHTILSRMKDARKIESTQFSPGVRQRGVAIPFGLLGFNG